MGRRVLRMDEERKRSDRARQRTEAEPLESLTDDNHFQRGMRRLSQRLAGSLRADAPGNSIWVLPTADGSSWIVPDSEVLEHSLQRQPQLPDIVIATDTDDRQVKFELKNAGSRLESMIRERLRRALKNLLRTLSVSLALLVGGVAAVWLWPAAGGFTMALGVALYLYSLVRHGGDALRTHYRRIDALDFARRSDVRRSRLLARLRESLDYRRRTPEAESGATPDRELIDAQAYRRLISQNETSIEELTAVARVVERELKLDHLGLPRRPMTQVAAEAGIDPVTAGFYCDLAVAAAEIRLDLEPT
jgi:hypothetical protein